MFSRSYYQSPEKRGNRHKAITATSANKSTGSWWRTYRSPEKMQHDNRQKSFWSARNSSMFQTPGSSEEAANVNRVPSTRLDYLRVLFQNGISGSLLNIVTPATVRKAATDKGDDARKAAVLAAQEQKVRELQPSEDILEKVKREMELGGATESSSRVMGESDDDMEVEEEDPKVALLAKRAAALDEGERKDALQRLQGSRNDNTIIIDKFNIDITVAKFVCLQPRTWLNDEVVNFYMAMLQERDARLCADSNGTRLPSHYFNSFFMTKLLENGKYTYAQVKRWSKKFDVFKLDKVFIPINLNNTHWVMAAVYVQRREVHYYDSMSGSGQRYLDAIMQWLVDEAREKKGQALDKADWRLIDREQHVPQQQNGYDCGVFSIMCADYVSDDLPLKYAQEGMADARVKIAAAIRRGHLTY